MVTPHLQERWRPSAEVDSIRSGEGRLNSAKRMSASPCSIVYTPGQTSASIPGRVNNGNHSEDKRPTERIPHVTVGTISTSTTFKGSEGGPPTGGTLYTASRVKLDTSVVVQSVGPVGPPEVDSRYVARRLAFPQYSEWFAEHTARQSLSETC